MILCFSDHPFPVWIWTPDDASEAEMEEVYQITKGNDLLDGEYKFNMKYSLAEYFMDRAKKDGYGYHIFLNLYAYDCQSPIRPDSEVDGQIYRCQCLHTSGVQKEALCRASGVSGHHDGKRRRLYAYVIYQR